MFKLDFFAPLKAYAMKIMAGSLIIAVIALVGLFLYYKAQIASKDLSLQKKETSIVKLTEDNKALLTDNKRLFSATQSVLQELAKEKEDQRKIAELYAELQKDNVRISKELNQARKTISDIRSKPGTVEHEIITKKLTPDLIKLLNGGEKSNAPSATVSPRGM